MKVLTSEGWRVISDLDNGGRVIKELERRIIKLESGLESFRSELMALLGTGKKKVAKK